MGKGKVYKGGQVLGCGGCSQRGCEHGEYCDPFKGKLRDYNGIRFTADGFDCALPVAIDGHSACSYRCQYCFANYLARDPHRKSGQSSYKVGQFRLRKLERMLDGGDGDKILTKFFNALETVGGPETPRCPVQVGALGDPFDRIERHQGWTLDAMKLFEKYEQPTRFSTKGGDLLTTKKYLKAFSSHPELYWIAFSIISANEMLLSRIDKDAPGFRERIKAMNALSKLGVQTSLRFRPIIPGISDPSWRRLLDYSADAGCRAVSMEFAFVPGAMPDHVKKMWKEIEQIAGWPMVKWYKETTSVFGSCLRSSRAWKEDLTFAIREHTHKLGMTFAISDPHWKELNDYGCCCGIPPDDPVFGGWQRKQATNAVLLAKQGERVSAEDGIPDWAWETKLDEMVCITGPSNAFQRGYKTWGDKLRETWNDTKSPRGPLGYFEGVLVPVDRLDNGDVVYQYKESKKRDRSIKVPYIKV